MSYITNINKIDSQLKEIFSEVKIDRTDFRIVNVICKNSIKENVNNNLEMRIFIKHSDLNGLNPVLEWGYFTDPTDLKNSILFRTPIGNIKNVIDSILDNNRLNESYLNSLDEKIDEGVDVDINTEVYEDINNINQTYKLSENHLMINISKLKSFLSNKLGMVVDDISIEYRDVNSGKVRKPSFVNSNNPMMGDEAEVTLFGISSKNYDGNISPAEWLKLETELRKLPMVEDVKSSTYSYSCSFSFSTKIFVELE